MCVKGRERAMIESAFVFLPRKRAWVGEREKWIPRCEFLNLPVLMVQSCGIFVD